VTKNSNPIDKLISKHYLEKKKQQGSAHALSAEIQLDDEAELKESPCSSDYLKQFRFPIAEKKSSSKKSKQKVGRPRKQQHEKVQQITVRLAPSYLEQLNQLPFGRGPSTRVKELLDFYHRKAHLEERQLAELTKRLKKISKDIQSFKKKSSQELLDSIEKQVKAIQTINLILQYEVSEIKGKLSREELYTYSFVLNWKFYEKRLSH
jgi:hypothetical protein